MSPLKKIACAVSISLLLAGTATAAPIVLDFEGVGDLAAVNDFYNGGTDAAGNSGTNYGINFSGTSLGIVDSDAGASGNFGNEASPSTVLFFTSGGAATMNVAAGFDTGFSFFYSSSQLGFVNVYDGLDATGNLLASLQLTATVGACSGDPSGSFCQFSPVGVTFAGIARSVDFGGSANAIGFDDITLGSVDPGNPSDLPEPATLALSMLGLAGLAASHRRRKQK